ASACLCDFAAELFGHGLEPVADAEHGYPEAEDAGVERWGTAGVDAAGPAAEHDPDGVLGADLVGADVVGHDLGVHACFPYAAGDELCVLGAEVDDEDGALGGVAHGAGVGSVGVILAAARSSSLSTKRGTLY